jgi:hypothetical protein
VTVLEALGGEDVWSTVDCVFARTVNSSGALDDAFELLDELVIDRVRTRVEGLDRLLATGD